MATAACKPPLTRSYVSREVRLFPNGIPSRIHQAMRRIRSRFPDKSTETHPKEIRRKHPKSMDDGNINVRDSYTACNKTFRKFLKKPQLRFFPNRFSPQDCPGGNAIETTPCAPIRSTQSPARRLDRICVMADIFKWAGLTTVPDA
ncbi:MAG: hypothetical protein KDA84_26950, partial [Planctomycetaceae bacterium]|nr:hypothetical protein [Planctomycetaceae bacterium]